MSLHHTITAFKDFIKESGLLPSYKVRERLASRYLKGIGLEIGALHLPLKVPAGVKVKYVDIASREENIKNYPELIADKIVETDYIENGFELYRLPDKSQDFVIANHVLEHAPNPLQVLLNWGRVIADGGILFISIPLAEKCFDKGRPLTSLDHIINDYQLCLDGKHEEFSFANRIHYREWLAISEPCIIKSRGGKPCYFSETEMVQRIDELDRASVGIHFHTFTIESMKATIDYFVSSLDTSFEILAIRNSRGGTECVAVLGKTRSFDSLEPRVNLHE